MRKLIFIFFISMACLPTYAQTWQPLGPFGSDQYNLKTSAWGGGTGQIHAFAFAARYDDSNKYHWYCASPWGGLWKSTDEGQNWIDINPQLEAASGICSCIDIAVDPHYPSTIYVANGRADDANTPDAPGIASTGVFQSTDGGKTFMPTGLRFDYGQNSHISRLVVNPWSKKGRIQLFATTDKGLYRSPPQPGKKWIRVADRGKYYTVQVSPNFKKNQTVYTSGDNVYVSRKGGKEKSFDVMEPSINELLPKTTTTRNINICIADRNGTDIIYAMVYQDRQNYFLYYDGRKWEQRKLPLVEGVYIPSVDRLKIAVDPTRPDHIYAGVTYVSMSDDGGQSWQLAGKYCQPGSQNDPRNIHGDVHAVSIIPGTNDVLIGTDGGVFRYVAAEKRDIELNNGLNISQVVGMSAPAQAPHKIMIGKQDTGFDIYDGHRWTNFYGGDGTSVHASPVDSTLYLCNMGYRFIADGRSARMERPASCKANENALFSNVAFDPKMPDRCFIAGTDISYSGDSAKTFTTLYKYHNPAESVDYETQIENIAVGHDDVTGESVIYASSYGFYNGAVCKMMKGKIAQPKGERECNEEICKACWTKVTLPHEKYEWLDNTSYSVSGIVVSPRNPEELWICYEHAIYEKANLNVLHSVDGGATWSGMDQGLPQNTDCTTMKYDAKTRCLYLATKTGMYINKTDGSTWQPFGTNLPRSYIKAIDINDNISKIRVGLYGRGVWETDLAGH